MIQNERISKLNQKRISSGSYVLYWMQASQRSHCNHALEFAIRQANDQNVPLLVYFGLTERYPEANERHYSFMLEGLKEVQASLRQRKIQLVIGHESPEVGTVRLSKKASLVVCDRGYLKIQRRWREYLARHINCPCIQVESDIVVPVEEASSKEEYTAATLRPKIRRILPRYLVPLEEQEPRLSSLHLDFDSLDITDIDETIAKLDIDRSVKLTDSFHGGASKAEKHLQEFISARLDRYPELRNDPTADYLSNMSPYLHFGQISPLYIALKVLETRNPNSVAFLEELIVRRELSINFVFYNQDYASFGGLPRWARDTLLEHKQDPRQYEYSLDELEKANTHDLYWNAAQRQMTGIAKMHGYMRMYWGKKIIEWSKTPEEAFQKCLYLNNKYELDGRDVNGFAGVAWCFGKHDRPWAVRPVFGNIRYMSADGLKRKFDADKYAKRYSPKEGKISLASNFEDYV